ncbi:MAG: hypothetical protein Q7P63_01130 [Verrucomicrobiota bacterium JB022]|nr:hypothetical protein [Verrucomicrobiota bacterium JB022]
MELPEVIPNLIALLRASDVPESCPILSSADAEHNRRLAEALKNPGIVIVVTLALGDPKEPSRAELVMDNQILISVLENPETNTSGLTCLALVQQVLTAIYRPEWSGPRGAKPKFNLGKPAYEAGPLDDGLTVYFVNATCTTR